MQIELPKRKVPVFINLNNVDYISKEAEDAGTITMSSGKEIKIKTGLAELLEKIKDSPYIINIMR